jgi:type IV pilus assembly protein PilA
MKRRNTDGFTLIEIVVVLIIVGILATIALPSLFSNVSKSRAVEAMGVIGSYRALVEGCIIKYAGSNNSACSSANLGNPASSPNFTYALTAPRNATDTGYRIVARGRNALRSTDTITVTRASAVWPAIGAISCVGASALAGGC